MLQDRFLSFTRMTQPAQFPLQKFKALREAIHQAQTLEDLKKIDLAIVLLIETFMRDH